MESSIYKEKWREICFILSESVKDNISEKEFEHQVVRALGVLGWREYKGEIERQHSIPIGRQGILKPDLVVYSAEKNALIAIEVKRPQEDLSRDDSISQLKSYMRQLKADFGFLIGNQVRVYYDGNLNPQTDPLHIYTIQLFTDETDGITFTELFEKGNFLSKSYLPILENIIRKYNTKQETEKLRNILLSEETRIKILAFLEKEFADYDSDLFVAVMSGLKLSIRTNLSEQPLQQVGINSTDKSSRYLRRSAKPNDPIDFKSSGKTYSLTELRDMNLGKQDKPELLTIRGNDFDVKNWTDIDKIFVKWLIENNFLNKDHLPIHSYSGKEKFFINFSKQHKRSKYDGQWSLVVEGFYVDSKYNADGHKKNILKTLEDLKMEDLDLKIKFR